MERRLPKEQVICSRVLRLHECLSAHQEVQDDDMNVICMGGHVAGNAIAGELVGEFLQAQLSGANRHRRRLAKLAGPKSRKTES